MLEWMRYYRAKDRSRSWWLRRSACVMDSPVPPTVRTSPCWHGTSGQKRDIVKT